MGKSLSGLDSLSAKRPVHHPFPPTPRPSRDAGRSERPAGLGSDHVPLSGLGLHDSPDDRHDPVGEWQVSTFESSQEIDLLVGRDPQAAAEPEHVDPAADVLVSVPHTAYKKPTFAFRRSGPLAPGRTRQPNWRTPISCHDRDSMTWSGIRCRPKARRLSRF